MPHTLAEHAGRMPRPTGLSLPLMGSGLRRQGSGEVGHEAGLRQGPQSVRVAGTVWLGQGGAIA